MQNNQDHQKESQYFIGIDLGTSFIKVALINNRNKVISIVRTPQLEMKIHSEKDNHSEQDPEEWWKNVCDATKILHDQHSQIFKNKLIKGIGISYQMHGLVLVDENHKILRNAIIWSDGRTYEIGLRLKQLIKQNKLQQNLLNYPGNFTISKLKWVQEKQPDIYKRIHKILLPGDFIALRLSNLCKMSQTGLSQGILWDYKQNQLSRSMLQICLIQPNLIPEIVSSFSFQGIVSQKGQKESMIPQGTPILYRSGDQPNNAYTLDVTEVGQVAASGGTSGTVLLVSDQKDSIELQRINTFLHVNHTKDKARYAKLLCINSCGIVYNWLRKNFAPGKSYEELNELAQSCESEGLMVIPFGNGLQRMLSHTKIKASIHNIDFNRHGLSHIIRASLESIAFSFVYGIKILKGSEKTEIKRIKCSYDGIFKCQLVVDIIETVVGCEILIVKESTGAVGSAKGALEAWRLLYSSQEQERIQNLKQKIPEKFEGERLFSTRLTEQTKQKYIKQYETWQKQLLQSLNSSQSK